MIINFVIIIISWIQYTCTYTQVVWMVAMVTVNVLLPEFLDGHIFLWIFLHYLKTGGEGEDWWRERGREEWIRLWVGSCCYLGNRHFKIFLCDMYSSLSESIHTSLCTYTLEHTHTHTQSWVSILTLMHIDPRFQSLYLDLCTRCSWHDFCYLPHINTSSKIHLTRVNP